MSGASDSSSSSSDDDGNNLLVAAARPVRKRPNDVVSCQSCLPQQPASKRLRFQEPDLIVEVGKQEFRHYSVILCAASPYFDTMLSCSEMREAREMKVIFPEDRDPEEWKVVSKFLEPCHTQKLTVKDIPKLLPWFHELQVDSLLQECNRLVMEKVKEIRRFRDKEPVNDFLVLLEYSDRYNLKDAREDALAYLEECISRGHIILGSCGVQRLIPFFRERQSLYDSIKKHLPDEFKRVDRDVMLNNTLFSSLISARWRLRSKQREERRRARRQRDIQGEVPVGELRHVRVRNMENQIRRNIGHNEEPRGEDI